MYPGDTKFFALRRPCPRVAFVLWQVAPDDPLILPELCKLLMPNNQFSPDAPRELLGKMGPAARAAILQVRVLMEDRNWRVRRAARDVLDDIRGTRRLLEGGR